MRWLVLGATGLLGPAFLAAIASRGEVAVSAARSGASANADITDLDALSQVLLAWKPDGVINCAALADLAACEKDPCAAFMVNARPLAALATWSARNQRPLIHISTDQMMAGSGSIAQSEDASVSFQNEYARSKYAGEALALTSPFAMVARTNIVGASKGFGAQLLRALCEKEPLTLFDDYYTSPIHIAAMAEKTLQLFEMGARGVFNVAGSCVASKADFAMALAARLGINCDWAQFASASTIAPARNLGLALNVTKAENYLEQAMPDLAACVDALAKEAGL
jgi:dTDP-4-dehydrorhamnose reductase